VRAVLVVLAMAMATILIRYGPPGARTFASEFSSIDGDPDGSIDIFKLPVALHDRTGLVTGFETRQPGPDDVSRFASSGEALAAPDAPEALLVGWLGGACEDSVEISVTGSESHLDVSVKANRSFSLFGYGCPSLGVPRRVLVGFLRPIDPTDVHVTFDGI